MPFAVGGFIRDHLGAAWRALLGRDTFGGSECAGAAWESLRKHAVDGIGPAAVVLDNPVGDLTYVT